MEPLWSEERIAEELAERSAPAIITVEAATDVIGEMQKEYVAVVAELEAEILSLEAEIAVLENPADVTVTVGAASSGVSHFVTGMQDVDTGLRGGSAIARGRLAAQMSVMATHVMNFGAPNLWPQEADGKPTNWGSLDGRMNMFLEMALTRPQAKGAEPALIFYNYPIWMKETVARDGVCTPCDPSQPFATDGRVRLDMFPQFVIYCKEIALRYMVAPYHVRVMVFGNEFKGYYMRRDGGSGHDAPDYTLLYNEWVKAMEEAATQLGIAVSDLKLGGCYAPIRCESAASRETYADAYPYGYYRRAPFDDIAYWVEHAVRADFVAFDMGSGNAVGPELTDTFTVQQAKYKDVAAMIRQMTDPYRAGLPMVIAEVYPKCADDMNADAQRVAAAKMVAHLSMVEAGYWMAWQWGAIGQGEYPNTNGGLLKDYRTGEPNPWYEAHQLLHDHFSAGAELYPVEVQGEGVYAKASGTATVLVNMTDGERSVRLGDAVHVLAANEVKVITSA